jgi:hypothetical protein
MFAFSTDNAAVRALFPAMPSANTANHRKLLVGDGRREAEVLPEVVDGPE